MRRAVFHKFCYCLWGIASYKSRPSYFDKGAGLLSYLLTQVPILLISPTLTVVRDHRLLRAADIEPMAEGTLSYVRELAGPDMC